jgi:membrane protease YdiL (CAAX protease family)
MAFRSARRLRATGEEGTARALPSRETIWISTLMSLGILFLLSWLVWRGFGYEIFTVPALGWRDLGAAVLALGACFAIRAVLRAVRPDDERRRLLVYQLVPRTGREWALKSATVLAAGVAEEAAYRGVGMSILWYALGNLWLAALICALAFALAHWTQGFKSGVAIFAIALVMHALVSVTGTLVVAMVVHILYDFGAGYLIARQAKLDEARVAGAG